VKAYLGNNMSGLWVRWHVQKRDQPKAAGVAEFTVFHVWVPVASQV